MVVWAVLEEVCGTKEAHHRMGWEVGERNLVFYAHDIRVAGTEPDWVQEALEMNVDMFSRVRLEKNSQNKNTMVCTPGFVWRHIREASYKYVMEGGNILVEEKYTGKLLRMRRKNGGFINTAPHGPITWGYPSADSGS